MPLLLPSRLPDPSPAAQALLEAAVDPSVPPDDLMALLRQAGPDARDPEGHTALMLAVRHGSVEQVSALASVSDRLAQNSKGENALHLAVLRRTSPQDTAAMEQRLRPLITPQSVVQVDRRGRTPLMHMLAWDAFTPGKALLLLAATDRLADVQTADQDGRTALMWAARFNNAAAVSLLIPLSNVNAQDRQGNTALSIAVQARAVDVVNGLAPCAAPWVGSNGETLLMKAAGTTFNNLAMVRALLPFSDPNARNAGGMTALEVAIGTKQWLHVPDLVRGMDRLVLQKSLQGVHRERLGRAVRQALSDEQDELRAVIDRERDEPLAPPAAHRRRL